MTTYHLMISIVGFTKLQVEKNAKLTSGNEDADSNYVAGLKRRPRRKIDSLDTGDMEVYKEDEEDDDEAENDSEATVSFLSLLSIVAFLPCGVPQKLIRETPSMTASSIQSSFYCSHLQQRRPEQ